MKVVAIWKTIRNVLTGVGVTFALGASTPLNVSKADRPTIQQMYQTDDSEAVKDIVARVNRQVNREIEYMEDIDQYGVHDKWVEDPVSNRGDCEDYALTKRSRLRSLLFPVVTRSQVVTLAIRNPDGTFTGHAVLEVMLPDGRTYVMDNNFRRLMTRETLEKRHGYQFTDW